MTRRINQLMRGESLEITTVSHQRYIVVKLKKPHRVKVICQTGQFPERWTLGFIDYGLGTCLNIRLDKPPGGFLTTTRIVNCVTQLTPSLRLTTNTPDSFSPLARMRMKHTSSTSTGPCASPIEPNSINPE